MKTAVLIFAFGAVSLFAGDLERKLKPALDAITPDGLLAHIKVLSSDEFEGRSPDAPVRSDEFDLKDCHQVTDEIHPDWDLAGAVQDAGLLFEVGYQVANTGKFPKWKPDSEFKPKRDTMMKK